MRVPPCFFLPCRIFPANSEDNVCEVILMSKKNKTRNESPQPQYGPGHGPVQVTSDSTQSSGGNDANNSNNKRKK